MPSRGSQKPFVAGHEIPGPSGLGKGNVQGIEIAETEPKELPGSVRHGIRGKNVLRDPVDPQPRRQAAILAGIVFVLEDQRRRSEDGDLSLLSSLEDVSYC